MTTRLAKATKRGSEHVHMRVEGSTLRLVRRTVDAGAVVRTGSVEKTPNAAAAETLLQTFLGALRKQGFTDEQECLDKLPPDHAARAREVTRRAEAPWPASSLDESLAAAIGAPKGVERLDLRGSAGTTLTRVPETIGALEDLRVLRLDGNGLEELPDEIDRLAKLEELHLANNRLASIPARVAFLKKLRVLSLHGNRISALPELGTYLKPGFELQLAGNPLQGSIPAIPVLGVFGADTGFVAKAVSCYDRTYDLSALHLYGRAPTDQEAKAIARVFPKAVVEHLERLEDGPKTSAPGAQGLEPGTAPATKAAKKPAKPAKTMRHPEQAAAIGALLATAKAMGVPAAHVKKHVRPCIDLLTSRADTAIAVGATRIGGLPDLPDAVPWPTAGGGPMVFVAQLRLEDLAPYDESGILPASGLLSFFVGDFAEGAVVHHAGEAPLRTREAPAGVSFAGAAKGPFVACAVRLAGAASLAPLDPDDAPDGWAELAEASTVHGDAEAIHRALGYELESTSSAIDADEIVILTVGSDDLAGMDWGDAGSLCFCFDPKALSERRWSSLRVVASA